MNKSFDMVILTRSIKHGEYCVAGIDVHTGQWIRLVSDDVSTEGALTRKDLLMDNHNIAELLDVAHVKNAEYCPTPVQTENYRIDRKTTLGYLGRTTIEDVLKHYPQPKKNEIFIGSSSVIQPWRIGKIDHSLELHTVTDLTFYKAEKSKADFSIGQQRFCGYSMTDQRYYDYCDRKLTIQAANIVCSLPDDKWARDNCYCKFIAAIYEIK